MDETDHRIIELLQSDGRANSARIARELRTNPRAIRRRISRLRRDGTIRVMVLGRPDKLGYQAAALVGIGTDPDKVDDVASALARLNEVLDVVLIAGSFDLFISLVGRDSWAVRRFVQTHVNRIPGVRRIQTFMGRGVYKRGSGLFGPSFGPHLIDRGVTRRRRRRRSSGR